MTEIEMKKLIGELHRHFRKKFGKMTYDHRVSFVMRRKAELERNKPADILFVSGVLSFPMFSPLRDIPALGIKSCILIHLRNIWSVSLLTGKKQKGVSGVHEFMVNRHLKGSRKQQDFSIPLEDVLGNSSFPWVDLQSYALALVDGSPAGSLSDKDTWRFVRNTKTENLLHLPGEQELIKQGILCGIMTPMEVFLIRKVAEI